MAKSPSGAAAWVAAGRTSEANPAAARRAKRGRGPGCHRAKPKWRGHPVLQGVRGAESPLGAKPLRPRERSEPGAVRRFVLREPGQPLVPQLVARVVEH